MCNENVVVVVELKFFNHMFLLRYVWRSILYKVRFFTSDCHKPSRQTTFHIILWHTHTHTHTHTNHLLDVIRRQNDTHTHNLFWFLHCELIKFFIQNRYFLNSAFGKNIYVNIVTVKLCYNELYGTFYGMILYYREALCTKLNIWGPKILQI